MSSFSAHKTLQKKELVTREFRGVHLFERGERAVELCNTPEENCAEILVNEGKMNVELFDGGCREVHQFQRSEEAKKAPPKRGL